MPIMQTALKWLLIFGWTSVAAAQKAPVAAPDIEVPVEVAPAEPTAAPAKKKKASKKAAAEQKSETEKKSDVPQIVVTTVEDKRLQAPKITFADGAVTLSSTPPQTVRIDEIQRIELRTAPKFAVDWVGQDQHDLTQVGSVDGGNGIQDIHLRVTGLPDKKIKQIAITRTSPFKVWRLDVSQSPHWKIALQRTGLSSHADLYLEPPREDLFGSQLSVTFTFSDGSAEKGPVKAATHTSNQTKATVAAETAAVPLRPAVVHLEAGDLLRGQLLRGTDEKLTVQSEWKAEIEVPLLQVRGVLFEDATPEAKARFEQLLAKPGAEDGILVSARDGTLTEIAGRSQQLVDGNLQVLYQGEVRQIKIERVQGLVLAAHPPVRTGKAPFQTIRLTTGDALSGAWSGLTETTLELKMPWGTSVSVPRESVTEIIGRNGKLINLSELEPSAIEQVPYFGRLMPYVRDRSWNNEPLKMEGKAYTRGLAVHARCVLTYALDGQFATFKTLVGFDDSTADRGRVVCRVLADGKEVFLQPDLRGSGKPQAIEVSVKGARQLTLEVDFGEEEDIGDRVIWAEPRLYRE